MTKGRQMRKGGDGLETDIMRMQREERIHVQEKADKEKPETSLEDFDQCSLVQTVKSREGKCHRHSHAEN